VTRKPAAIREREAQPAEPAGAVRPDGRTPRQLRPLKIERGVIPHAEGSAIVTLGRTRVLVTATVEERVPPWLRGQQKGWVTAEYGMLPRATTERTNRASQTGGRAQEIQRLIGRSLRAITNLHAFGERIITVDCDVLEADGGTRTAAIDGAMVALHDALVWMSNRGWLKSPPFTDTVAAISVGVVDGTPCLDLCYAEDSRAQVDMNVVMTGAGRFVEVQGTGESATFTELEMRRLIALARSGIRRVTAAQLRLIGGSGLVTAPPPA